MLMKRMGVDLDNVVKTICVLQITFCVIHNICQKMEDLYINDNEVLENVLENGDQELQPFVFCTVTVNDEHTKPSFKRKLRGKI